MSYFSIGGNAGFALGPALVLLVLTTGGLSASPFLAVPGLLAAVLLAREVGRIRGLQRSHASRGRAADAAATAMWGPFTRLATAAVVRAGAFFALQALIPLYFVWHLGTSDSVGTVALIAMLAAGAVGTLVGGLCADRFGRRSVLIWAMLPATACLLALPHVGIAAFFVVLIGVGLTLDAPFSTTVVLGQEYIPARPGLASGITLGLAIGLGGLLATGLGALADATDLRVALLVLPACSVLGLVLALSLPAPGRRARPAGAPAGAEPVPEVSGATP
jgi:FSR family fosmidomycin resistance protein-like MFS transporter